MMLKKLMKNMKSRRCGIKGLTLIEVIVAMAFISLVYVFVVQIFFSSYKNITFGDVQSGGVLLAKNKMISLASIENPIYIGLSEADINALKKGEVTPYQLKERGTIELNVRKTVSEEESDNSEEVRNASRRVDYVRKTEWSVEDVQPVLVHVWVTVSWTDPKKEIKNDTYVLETLFAP